MLKIAVALQWLFFLQFIEDMKRRVVYLWGEWQLLNTGLFRKKFLLSI